MVLIASLSTSVYPMIATVIDMGGWVVDWDCGRNTEV